MAWSRHFLSAVLSADLRLVSLAPGSRRHTYKLLVRAVECGLRFVADLDAREAYALFEHIDDVLSDLDQALATV